jgi:hypothetical protein
MKGTDLRIVGMTEELDLPSCGRVNNDWYPLNCFRNHFWILGKDMNAIVTHPNTLKPGKLAEILKMAFINCQDFFIRDSVNRWRP